MKNLVLDLFEKHESWYWRISDKNGVVLAVSERGYGRKSDARRGIIRLTTALACGEYEVRQ